MIITWQIRLERIIEQLKVDFPGESPEWCFEEANKIIRREWGPEPKKEEPVKNFVNRWGVLISVVYLGLGAVLQVIGINTEADPATATLITTMVAGGLALYGVARKTVSQVKKAKK